MEFVFEIQDVRVQGYNDYWTDLPKNPYEEGSFEYNLWEQGFYQAMEDDTKEFA